MLIGDLVYITVEKQGEKGIIKGFTNKRVKVELQESGKIVTRNRIHVQIRDPEDVRYGNDPRFWDDESEQCCEYRDTECRYLPVCREITIFFRNETRNPTKQTRYRKGDLVRIDTDISTPEREELALVLGVEKNKVVVYRGGSSVLKYNKERVQKLRVHPFTVNLAEEYKKEAIKNDIERPEREVETHETKRK